MRQANALGAAVGRSSWASGELAAGTVQLRNMADAGQRELPQPEAVRLPAARPLVAADGALSRCGMIKPSGSPDAIGVSLWMESDAEQTASPRRPLRRADRRDGAPELTSDYERLQALAKERASLEEIVSLYRRYRETEQGIADARAVLEEAHDPEMEALAREEMERLGEQKQRLEDDIRRALLPPDPRDEKSVIVEIRAGTGGDEAALFAADLFRMYTRYAEATAGRSRCFRTARAASAASRRSSSRSTARAPTLA